MDELEEVLCLERWGGAAGKAAFEAVSSVRRDVTNMLFRRRYGRREDDGCVGFDVYVVGFDGGWLRAWTCAVGAGG